VINPALTRGRMSYAPSMGRAPFRVRGEGSPASARIKIILGAVAYIVAFHWAYATILARSYDYEGFRYRDDPAIISVTWLLALVPSFWMPSRLTRPSQLAYWFFYLVIVVPVAVVTIHSYPGDAHSGILTAVLIVSAFAVLGLSYTVPPAAIPHHRFQPHGLWLALLLVSTLSYGLIFSVFGIRFNFGSLSDIYAIRAEYKTIVENTNVYISYAVDWQALVLNPLLIILGLLSRRKLLVALGAVGQFMIYSFTGYRTVFFSTILLLVLFLLCRSRDRFGIRMLWVLTGTVAGATALFLWFGSMFLGSLIVERLIGLPGLLTGFYFSFFGDHAKMTLSHSILRGLVNNPYGEGPPVIIGRTYFPGWGTYANANFWADAFANFGIWGVFAFTAILGVVLWLYDSITLDTDLRLAALVLVMPAISLSNSGLFTCLLTHGLGLAFLVMYFLPNRIQAPAVNQRAGLQYVPVRSSR
jgi:hypothetical protein